MKTINSKVVKPFKQTPIKSLKLLTIASALAFQTACMSTNPMMGGSDSTVTGAAGGANASENNTALEKCDTPLGTASIFEDTTLPWWQDYRRTYPKVGSTVPILRLMIQQSNCFVIVERGRAMNAMNRERQLMQSGQLRNTSNIGAGQMVAADYTVSPEVMFAEKTSSGKAIGGALLGGLGSLVGGAFDKNEAATTLMLIDNRSGVQLSSSYGSSSNYDFGMFAGMFGGGVGGAGGAYSKTPEGKMLTTAFADSFNNMVKALRNYKAQEVEGGLGNGGSLSVSGAQDAKPQTQPIPQEPSPPLVSTAVYVEPTPASTSVNRSKSYNFDIDEYDEDAFNQYFEWLKNTGPLVTAFASFDPENNSNAFGGMSISSVATMLLGQLDTYRIELEAWPYEARAEAWRVMGKRIESHSKIFERNRQMALKNERLSEDVRYMISDIQLVTKENLFPEGI